jgi:NAD(P)-dependent dehydrogenase (short-subunit alcohol dehydrogenase family)
MNMAVIETREQPHFPGGVAVVVGGSGGIGAAICERLAQHGSDVALTYRSNKAKAEEAAAKVSLAGRRAHAGALDLADYAAVTRFFDETAAAMGRIHTIVFAIGADISMSYVSQIDLDEWHRTIEGDLTGFLHVLKAGLPHLRQGGGGSIVAMSTAGIERHPPKDILSVVPKAGMEALVRGVAREEGRFGIRANSVGLGVIDAGLFLRLEERLTPQFIEAMKNNTSLRRFGTAREAADAAVFLASSVSGFITGQRLMVDGGYAV